MTTTFVVNASGESHITKDPDATLDYSWDWSAWLTALTDTLASSSVTVDGVALETAIGTSGITVTGNIITAWIKGGTVGGIGSATCHIVTAAGRKEDRTLFFDIAER